jgi:hypothetical protein
MPTDVSNTSAVPGAINRISNSLDDMHAPGIGPDQSDCRVKVISYVSFDYAGKYKDDPFIAVKATCEPLDGSNEGKDFDIEWTTGAKASDYAIVDDGGYLTPTGAKSSLTNTSNWALLQRSLKDASFNLALLNGDRGIRALEGIEWTVRRIPQPKRDGIANQDPSAREQKYYTCLKIIALPGEKKPAAARRAPAKPAAAPAAPAPTSAPAPAAAASNATGDAQIAQFVISALAASGGTLALADVAKAVFQQAKAAGLSARDSSESGKKAATEDFLIEQGMETSAWVFDNGVVTATA